jgi:hypothetical protein
VAGWALEPVWTWWGREKFPALPGLEPQIIQPVALRYTQQLFNLIMRRFFFFLTEPTTEFSDAKLRQRK